MRVAVGGVIIGCVLMLILVWLIPPFYAWLAAALCAIVVQLWCLRKQVQEMVEESIGFWILIGTLLPMYQWVLNHLIRVLY